MSCEKFEIFDCTIRDGGFLNNWYFGLEFCREFVYALSTAGIRFVEMGYLTKDGIFDKNKFGPFRFINESLVRKLISGIDIIPCAMMEVGRYEVADIVDSSQSVIKAIRVAAYWTQLEEALLICSTLKSKGYFVCLNLVNVSQLNPKTLVSSLKSVSHINVDVVYIVDTFGALYPHDIEWLFSVFSESLPNKKIGLHSHNNLQLSFYNSLKAVEIGINFVDCTLNGIGRGVGNCNLELLMMALKKPRYDVKPLLRFIDKWKDEIPQLPTYDLRYLITATNNVHHKEINHHNHKGLLEFYENIKVIGVKS